MYYLQRKRPLIREQAAKAELRRFAGYGASIHQRGDSRFFDLLIPIDQRPLKVQRQARWFEQAFPDEFQLVNVSTFDPDAGVISEPVDEVPK